MWEILHLPSKDLNSHENKSLSLDFFKTNDPQTNTSQWHLCSLVKLLKSPAFKAEASENPAY